MIKTFLITVSLQILLYSSQQIILVVSNDFNSSKAYMECYEGDKKRCGPFEVNLGANGLGWGLGEKNLSQKKGEPIKHEGDKKAPAGIFKLTHIFGDAKNGKFALPYIQNCDMICVDDSNSPFYNHIITMPKEKPKSFERMSRDDHQYVLGVVVGHNQKGVKKRGSCIFLHIEKSPNTPTAGCTSMTLEQIQTITSWLDEKKHPLLIQIAKPSAKEVLKLYPELQNSKLLN